MTSCDNTEDIQEETRNAKSYAKALPLVRTMHALHERIIKLSNRKSYHESNNSSNGNSFARNDSQSEQQCMCPKHIRQMNGEQVDDALWDMSQGRCNGNMD